MRDSPPSWQKILADGFGSVEALLHYLELPMHLGSAAAEQSFKTRVSRQFAARMQKANPEDPLLLQVLASHAEQAIVAGYSRDSLQEKAANAVPGLIHKYKNRVLLTVTGICAINCRFCFRRHFSYDDNNPGSAGWQKVCDYIAGDTSINEVILSGGDPLLASDQQLRALVEKLSKIAHLRTVRIHSRIPIVLTERIQEELLSIIPPERFHIVTVLHCNHPQELDESVHDACRRMKKAGWVLLNQTVLLNRINDSADILSALNRKLFDYGVLPYYLHLPDKVTGTHHFDLPLMRAHAIFRALQEQLPGYLVPRLVYEEPAKPSKTIV